VFKVGLLVRLGAYPSFIYSTGAHVSYRKRAPVSIAHCTLHIAHCTLAVGAIV